jgi:uncharacterized protein (DUF1697 family)
MPRSAPQIWRTCFSQVSSVVNYFFQAMLLVSKSTYIALLRGINIGPHKRIKMEALQRSLRELGFEDVKTYIQSGNAVFKAPAADNTRLANKIEKKLLSAFGFPVPVIVRTPAELQQVIQNNLFLNEAGIDTSKLHVTFLSGSPEKIVLKSLDRIAAGADRFNYGGKEIYLHCPNGYGETKLSNGALEKALSVQATTRNWKTVNKLYEMALE